MYHHLRNKVCLCKCNFIFVNFVNCENIFLADFHLHFPDLSCQTKLLTIIEIYAFVQEELAASKLREAESNLALKDLRAKVSQLLALLPPV